MTLVRFASICIALVMLAALPPSSVRAEGSSCSVKRQPLAKGQTSSATMVLRQGGTCRFRFKFGNVNPPDSWQLVTPPKSGKVVFTDDSAEYVPDNGFSGTDRFVVAVFGKEGNCGTRCTRDGRFDIAVTVKPN